jgi:UDP-galactopyranose mutase
VSVLARPVNASLEVYEKTKMVHQFKVIIVGAGFFGATIAERIANDAHVPTLVVDKRSHVGGNSWSEIDPDTGIEHHRYGSHLFHTSNEEVWRYIRRFGDFNDYRHRVHTVHAGCVYTMPINLGTICAFYKKHLSPAEARQLIETEVNRAGIIQPNNLEEKAISLMGRPLYEAFIKEYTKKQWQTDPSKLPASIVTRLPVRFDFNDRYFSDTYEGLPLRGYASIFESMLSNSNIKVMLNTDFFSLRSAIKPNQLVIFTGAIDRYFGYQCGKLGWRTLDFEREALNFNDYQGTSVMNYADADVPFTRIHEFKHLHPERKYEGTRTLIAREYSRFALEGDEPYYPIATVADKAIYNNYKLLAANTNNVIFGGRLGTYRYIDMHQAIGAALNSYTNRVLPFLKSGVLPNGRLVEQENL